MVRTSVLLVSCVLTAFLSSVPCLSDDLRLGSSVQEISLPAASMLPLERGEWSRSLSADRLQCHWLRQVPIVAESSARATVRGFPGGRNLLASRGTRGPVTVHLKDGVVYPNGRIRVDWDYMVVIVGIERKDPSNITFESIESIIDAAGQDITDEVLGEYSPNVVESESGKGSLRGVQGAALERRELPWKFAFTVSPAYSIPWGDGFEGTESHLGFRALTLIGISKEMAIEIGFQHQPMGVDPEYLRYLEQILGVENVELTREIKKLFGGARYLGRSRNAPIWVYLSFGGGVYEERVQITLQEGGGVVRGRGSETDIALTWAAGMIYKFSPRVGIDLGGRFDMVFGTTEGIPDTKYGYLVEFGGGLTVGF